MATTPPKIEFTGRDFDTNLQLLKEYISSRSPESWNSYSESDLGKMLLDVISYDHAMTSYVIDAQTQESFIDTLRLRESLTHFSNLTGYAIRRNTPASVEVYAQLSAVATIGYFIIPKGTQVTSTSGLIWEVAENVTIETGKYTPITKVNEYGDVVATVFNSEGTSSVIKGLVKIEQGSSRAILTDYLGNRLSSEFSFSNLAGEGHILCLLNMLNTATSTESTASFTSPPDVTRNEFAITSVGKFSYDVYDRGVLFLDRPWDGATDFIGKWRIENRNIPLTQGETKKEVFTTPTLLNERKNWSFKSSFYPVISAQSEEFIVSGLSGLSRSTSASSGIDLFVNGVQWQETPSLLFNTFEEQVFEVKFDANDQIQVNFGDGIYGKLIPENATVDITYRIGGGKEGNVPQNAFNYSLQVSESATGSPNDIGETSSLYLSNPYTTGRGGQDRESIETAKRNLTQFVRTNDRAVGSVDYDYLASNFVSPEAGRVKYAKGILNKNTVPREQNVVWVYVWVEGSNGQLVAPTLTLKSRLLDYLALRKMIGDEIVVLDGITNNVPLRFFYKYSTAVTDDIIREKVASAVNEKLKGLVPGQILRISQLYEAVESVAEVEYALFENPSEDYKPSAEMAMIVNTLQQPKRTVLLMATTKGQTSVVVDDPSIFFVGGVISLFQRGKKPTTATVESVTDSVVTIRPETPLQANYDIDGTSVLNSDYWGIGWQYDLPVDVYINYAPTSGTSSLAITSTIERKIKEYFTFKLLPSEILLKSTLESVVSSTNGVGSYRVNLNSLDSATELINPSARERVVLRNLVINGKSY